MARFLDARWYGGPHGSDVLQDVEPLMCIPKSYWDKLDNVKACGEHTPEEKIEAYKAAYQDHIKDGKWTYEQLIEWFPRQRAGMTAEQVVEFANAARSR